MDRTVRHALAFMSLWACMAGAETVTLFVDDFARDDDWVGTNWLDSTRGSPATRAILAGARMHLANLHEDAPPVTVSSVIVPTRGRRNILLATTGAEGLGQQNLETADSIELQWQAPDGGWQPLHTFTFTDAQGDTFGVTNKPLGSAADDTYIRLRYWYAANGNGSYDSADVHSILVTGADAGGQQAEMLFFDHAVQPYGDMGWVCDPAGGWNSPPPGGSEYIVVEKQSRETTLTATIDTTGHKELVLLMSGRWPALNNDECRYEYSTDGGDTWTTLGGAYPRGVHPAGEIEAFIALPPQAANTATGLQVRVLHWTSWDEQITLDLVEVLGMRILPKGTVLSVQ